MNDFEFNGDIDDSASEEDAAGDVAAAIWSEITNSTAVSGSLAKALANAAAGQGRSGPRDGGPLDKLGNVIKGDPNAKGEGGSLPGGGPLDKLGNVIKGDPNAKGEGGSLPGGGPLDKLGNVIKGGPNAKGEGGSLPGGGPGKAPDRVIQGKPTENGAGGPAGGESGLSKIDGKAAAEMMKLLEKSGESLGQQVREALMAKDTEQAKKAFEKILEKSPPPAGCEKMTKELGTALLTGDTEKARELLKNIRSLEDGKNLLKTCDYLRKTLGVDIEVTGHPFAPSLTIKEQVRESQGLVVPDIHRPPVAELIIDSDGGRAVKGFDFVTGKPNEMNVQDVAWMLRNKMFAKLSPVEAKK
ncbi:MAG: hypothetical protein K2W95_08105 [Candidatus Obscuribacterales bacterium]|nr:hypothetical protein [Candidatus Obscuribacterales bacterium]